MSLVSHHRATRSPDVSRPTARVSVASARRAAPSDGMSCSSGYRVALVTSRVSLDRALCPKFRTGGRSETPDRLGAMRPVGHRRWMRSVERWTGRWGLAPVTLDGAGGSGWRPVASCNLLWLYSACLVRSRRCRRRQLPGSQVRPSALAAPLSSLAPVSRSRCGSSTSKRVIRWTSSSGNSRMSRASTPSASWSSRGTPW